MYIAGFVGKGFGFSNKQDLVWYVLFILFVPYAMLPLPLKWCMVAGSLSSIAHTILLAINLFDRNYDDESDDSKDNVSIKKVMKL